MNITGIMPVRNEDWVLGMSARVALMWCDSLAILDHASTDSTPSIIEDLQSEFGDRVITERIEGEWDEMAHRQLTLEGARSIGATHVAIIDADEILTGNLLGDAPSGHCCVRGMVETLEPGNLLQLPCYNLRGSIHRYHATGIWGNRVVTVAFKDDGYATWQGDRFHHREPMVFANVPYRPVAQGEGGIMHLWGADERRLIARHALYKVTERLRWPDKSPSQIDHLYNLAIHADASNGTGFSCVWQYASVPSEWWNPYQDFIKYLNPPETPWQEVEANRLYEKHGSKMFAGLDLFGVVAG